MCDFPAAQLLLERRQLADSMAPDKDHDLKKKAYMRIREIDELRWRHFDETRCDCWHHAREAFKDYERMRAAKLAAPPGVSVEAFIAAHTTPEAMEGIRERMQALVAVTPQEVAS